MKRFGVEKQRAIAPQPEMATVVAPPRARGLQGLQPLIGNHAVAAMLQANGESLGTATRVEMEARFGEDLGSVRLHTGEKAKAAAEAINAEAFTVGEDVGFNDGRLSPNDGSGKRLLAHELAHVIQQRRSGSSPAGGPEMERSASKIGGEIVKGKEHVEVEGAGEGIARQKKSALPLGPAVTYIANGDTTELAVGGVPVLTYTTSAADLSTGISWDSKAPEFVHLWIRRKPNTEVSVLPKAMAELNAAGYVLIVHQELLPVDSGEIRLNLQARPARPRPSRATAKPATKAPSPNSAPDKEEELPPLPFLEVADLAPLPPLPEAITGTPQPAKVRVPTPEPPALSNVEDTPPVRTPEQLVDDHTSWWGNLQEEELGADLLKRSLLGDPDYAQRVLDALGSTDRDDVAVAFAEAATDEQLKQLADTFEGRRLLDRLFDELTAGEVGADEQKQADRTRDIKTRALRTGEQLAAGIEEARRRIVLPYKKGGLTVLTPSPIYARRLPDGKIAIHLRSDIFGTAYARDKDVRLPNRIWDEVVLNETDIVGVKFYDEGGMIGFFPALYLLQLENEATRIVLEKAGEAFGIGLTLGFGGGAAAGGEAAGGTTAAVSTLARVGAGIRTGILWADRIAFTLDITNSLIQEHRGWIIDTWKDDGRAFVTSVDQITSYVRIYGLARGGAGLVQLGNSLRKSYATWRAVAKASKLSANELEAVELISQDTEKLLEGIDDVAKNQPAAPSSPIRDVIEGGGQATPQRAGHLRVADAPEEVGEIVIAAEEVAEEFPADIKAVSGSKERFSQPRGPRRIVTSPAAKPQTTTVTTTAVQEAESAVPKKSGGGKGGGGGAKTGTAVEQREIKRYVVEKSKEALQGIKPDPTEFLALHEKVTIGKRTVGGNSSFKDIAGELDRSSNLRVQANKPPLPLDPAKTKTLLAEGERNFIQRHPDLETLYQQLDDLAKGKSVPELESLALSRERIGQIREEVEALQVRRIGNLRTDITEIWFDQKRVEIADISLRANDPLHTFKTLLYKRVMEEMLPGFGVRAQDIKPTTGNYWEYLFQLVGE